MRIWENTAERHTGKFFKKHIIPKNNIFLKAEKNVNLALIKQLCRNVSGLSMSETLMLNELIHESASSKMENTDAGAGTKHGGIWIF